MSKPKTIQILGAGQWQIPTIQLAKKMGYRVVVTDMYRKRPGYAFADEHECVDITDLEGTLRVAERHRVDGIVCDTTDVGVPAMAYVAERLGLPGIGYEIARSFTEKHRMRELTKAAGLSNPPFRLVVDIQGALGAIRDLGLPAVVKPVDSQSSRGVHIIRSYEFSESYARDALNSSRSGRAIIEGFLDGTELTVESFCSGGEVFVAGISDKDHFPHRPEVASRLTYPAALPTSAMERVRTVNEGVIRALGLKTGIAHAEYILAGGEVYLVEIAARGAGSRVYSHIVPYLAGTEVPRAYLEFIVGGEFSARPDGASRAANLAFFSFSHGTVKRIHGLAEAGRIPGVQEVLLEFDVGHELRPPEDDRSRPGLTVVFGATRREVLERTADVFQTVCVEFE